MHKIAYIIEDQMIFWSPIILALGVLAAVLMFLGLHLGKTGKATGAFVAIPLALFLSMIFGRLLYWLCLPESYESLAQAFSKFGMQDYCLAGAFAGCALAACMVRFAGLIKDLPAMLDAMSLAGALGIAVGKLNHVFNTGGRSIAMETGHQYPVFWIQSALCAALFVVLLIVFFVGKQSGSTCLLFCLIYGCTQVVLGGVSADALCLPGIDAMTLSQIGGLVLIATSGICFCWRMVRIRGWKMWYFALFLPMTVAFVSLAAAAHRMDNTEYLNSDYFGTTTASAMVLIVFTATVIILGIIADLENKRTKNTEN